MPFHETTPPDPLTPMIEIHASAVFEMLISMQGILPARPFRGLRDEVSNALGTEFLGEVERLYRFLPQGGIPYVEMACEYESRDDVVGFIDYVANMPDHEFVYQFLHRRFRREEIPDNPTQAAFDELVQGHELSDLLRRNFADRQWLDDIPGVRDALCELWRRYWNDFFKERFASIQVHLHRWTDEYQRLLDEVGGSRLIDRFWRFDALPPPDPPEYPLTRIELVPVYHMSKRLHSINGYGEFNVFIDCKRTDEDRSKFEEYRRRSLAALKALADEKRMWIAKMTAGAPGLVNATRIAEFTGLSQSVVSRHLTRLKEVGLIDEFTNDNRSLTYAFNFDRLHALVTEFETFLRD